MMELLIRLKLVFSAIVFVLNLSESQFLNVRMMTIGMTCHSSLNYESVNSQVLITEALALWNFTLNSK